MACSNYGQENKCSAQPVPPQNFPGQQQGITMLSPSLPGGQNINIRRQIYEGFISYCGDLHMTKLYSNNDNFSLYGARISCFCSDLRYVYVLTVPDHAAYGQTVLLSSLSWTSFQTRTSKTDHNLPVQSYRNGSQANHIIGSIIRQIREDGDRTVYKVENLPLQVDILGEDGNSGGYHTDGTIGQALETFSTVIYFR